MLILGQSLITMAPTVIVQRQLLKTLNPYAIEVVWTPNLFLEREENAVVTGKPNNAAAKKENKETDRGTAAWM